MSQIDLKKTRWFKYFYEIQQEFELTAQQTMLYGYLFRHCQYHNDGGYCGYSDQRIADELNVSYERFRKELAVLKNKKLIVIKNPGKRSKQTGQSRMIYINTEIFIQDDQMTLTDVENENLKKENERLKKQLEQLNKKLENLVVPNKQIYGNVYTITLYKKLMSSKLIDENQKDELYVKFNAVYEGLAVDYGHNFVMKHIEYIVGAMSNAEKPIKNVFGYMYKAIMNIRKTKNFIDQISVDGEIDDEKLAEYTLNLLNVDYEE